MSFKAITIFIFLVATGKEEGLIKWTSEKKWRKGKDNWKWAGAKAQLGLVRNSYRGPFLCSLKPGNPVSCQCSKESGVHCPRLTPSGLFNHSLLRNPSQFSLHLAGLEFSRSKVDWRLVECRYFGCRFKLCSLGI